MSKISHLDVTKTITLPRTIEKYGKYYLSENFTEKDQEKIAYINTWINKKYLAKRKNKNEVSMLSRIFAKNKMTNYLFKSLIDSSIPTRTRLYLAEQKAFYEKISNYIKQGDLKEKTIVNLNAGFNTIGLFLSKKYPNVKFIDTNLLDRKEIIEGIQNDLDFQENFGKMSGNYEHVEQDLTKEMKLPDGKALYIAVGVLPYFEQNQFVEILKQISKKNNDSEVMFSVGITEKPADEALLKAADSVTKEETATEYPGDYKSFEDLEKKLTETNFEIKERQTPVDLIATESDDKLQKSVQEKEDVNFIHLVQKTR